MWRTRTGNRTLHGPEAELLAAAIRTVLVDLGRQLSPPGGRDGQPDPRSPDAWGGPDAWDGPDAWGETGGVDETGGRCGPFGISVFDDLQVHQRIALLHRVARYLLTETAETLPLNAVHEATIGVLFAEIRVQVLRELGADLDARDVAAGPVRAGWSWSPEKKCFWRQLALQSFRQSQRRTDATEEIAAGIVPGHVDDPEVDRWENLVEWLADNILWDRDYEIADCFLDADPGQAQQRKAMLGIDEDYFTAIAPDPLPEQWPGLISETQRLVRRYPR